MSAGEKERTIYQPIIPRVWNLGRVYARGPMKDGLREGRWTFWYLSGAKQMEGDFSRGKKTGTWVKYWENGNPQSRGELVEGRMNGSWTDWYPDGKKAQESEWKMGRRSGPAVCFDRTTGRALPQSVQAGPEPVEGYTLLSDRDVSMAIRRAARSGIKRSWQGLVGRRIGSLVEPWQAAVWVLLLPIFYRYLDAWEGLGYFILPLTIVLAGLAGVGLTALSLVHDHFTGPDIGT